MPFNYELYKVFYHVASTLSFSEASKQLFISQSAVSQSIKTLERKLDQTLFIRSTKHVQLTPEGEILLRHIEPAMHFTRRGEAQLLDAAATGGQIRIGASDTICRYFLVPYLERFHRDFPSAHIQSHQSDFDQVRRAFGNRTGRSNRNQLPEPIPEQRFFDQEDPYISKMCFIANKSFEQLKGQKLSYEQLSKYPILMLDKRSTTSEFLHRLFQQHHLGSRSGDRTDQQ